MWEIILGIGIFFLILEIIIPSGFFINFALSCFACAVLSLYIHSKTYLIIAFAGLSLILMYLIRPLFTRKKEKQEQKTGLESKYVGKTATVIEDVDSNSGAITIYDERWQARCENDCIKACEKVEIIGYDSLIMKVVRKK